MNLQEMIEERHEELVRGNARLTEENPTLAQERDKALLGRAETEARIIELEKLLQKNGMSIPNSEPEIP